MGAEIGIPEMRTIAVRNSIASCSPFIHPYVKHSGRAWPQGSLRGVVTQGCRVLRHGFLTAPSVQSSSGDGHQVGKSTLASLFAAGREALTVTLDDPSTLAIAEEDPAFFVTQASDRLLTQRAQGIILPLKATVDRDRRPRRFLLTGTADRLQV